MRLGNYDDVKAFLEYGRGCVQKVYITLPLKTRRDYVNVPWKLVVQVKRIRGAHAQTGPFDTKHVVVSLIKEEDHNYSSSDSKILVSQCTFSILNGPADQRFHTTTIPSVQCKLGERKGIGSVRMFDYSRIDRYLYRGKLTIQVKATLHCFTQTSNLMESSEISEIDLPLYRGLKTLLDDKLFVDVTLKCGQKEFKAHKAVLASQSPFFKSMFETDMKDNVSTNVIEISNTEPEVVAAMLSYLYTGTAPNIEEMLKDLLVVADKYQISELSALCEKRLKSDLSVSNVVDSLILANMHNAPCLKTACLAYIRRHTSEVQQTAQWQNLKDNFLPLLMEAVNFTL